MNNQSQTEDMTNGGSTNISNNNSRLRKDLSNSAATNSRILQHEKNQIPLPSIVKQRQASNAMAENDSDNTRGATQVSNYYNSAELTPGAWSADQDGFMTQQAPAPLRYCSFVRRSTELAKTEDLNDSNQAADRRMSSTSQGRRRSSISHDKVLSEKNKRRSTFLPAANAIAENQVTSFYASLPKAEELDPVMGDRNQEEHKQQRRRKTHFILGTMVLFVMVAIVAIVLGIVLSKQGKENDTKEPPTSATPTDMPSQNPTSHDDYIMSLLPEHSILGIQQNPESPQSKAWQWLIEQDRDSLQIFSDDRILQKYALATLYFATEGESWTHNDNWLNRSIHECEWYTKQEFGMTSFLSGLYPGAFQEVQQTATICDPDTGLYHHLWLDQNNLVGALPDELFLLTSLSSLSASFNKELKGPIPSQIGQLTQLEGLGISFISRGGSIPSEIDVLTKLNSLALFGNNHDGTMPTELWQLSNLQTFSLIRNQNLKGMISTEIGNFQFLHHFNLGECDMSGTIPSEIGQATALEWITLHANGLSGNVSSELGRLARLRILGLFENALEGALPTELGLLTSSLVMSFRYNQLTDHVPSELGLLSNLTFSLVLANNSLSGQIPSEVGLLSNLGEISLENNYFSGPVPDQLGKLLLQSEEGQPALHTLNIKGNPFLTGTVPSDLCNINGICQPNNLDPCEEPYGLLFDCSLTFCGCSCSCFAIHLP
ncbi:Leucine Rich Repeat [Seminavis robusta]|uniref:Leucine Rich Repeat n=1 Tax=Seminavis robusta TaxID=568900 RepID=A0A9N8EDD0_9STRA|nr:Leucine Rich Repeat [Seminavis robusta]|eukprot:Sro837_g209140.1 Leucine Rich Repeat (716) ;mRNA; f:19675-21917